MKKTLFIALLLLSLPAWAIPGRLLLVGGGTERSQETAWNAQPYQWAVQNAQNKRVAIVATDAEDDPWLREYFLSLGAHWCSHLALGSRAVADSPATYDTLSTYDMVFLKGGDQYEYYSYFKGTRAQTAFEEIFQSGGVLAGTSAGMAILSEVIFTAQNNTVYPDEALEDPFNSYMTLADDLFDFMPGYLFDTHFAERGRLGRLLAFLGNRHIGSQQALVGIGIDDLTALAIDTSNIATAYGTGAATFLRLEADASFQQQGQALTASGLRVTQLLHGQSIDLDNGQIQGFENQAQLPQEWEAPHCPILLSGGDLLQTNADMLANLVLLKGQAQDPILIVTGPDDNSANAFKDKLLSLGATDVRVLRAIAQNIDDSQAQADISAARKILFLGNDPSILTLDFLEQGAAGQALAQALQPEQPIACLAFVGDNSRLAGQTLVEGYDDEGASYYAETTFAQGLALLRSAVVMPRSFEDADWFENTHTGVPYAMVQNNLLHGFWLDKRNYLEINPQGEFLAYGSLPVMHLAAQGGGIGVSRHTATGSSGSPRQIAGFEHMELEALLLPQAISALPNARPSDVRLWPNPATGHFQVEWPGATFTTQAHDLCGRLVFQLPAHEGVLRVAPRAQGWLLLSLRDVRTGQVRHLRVFVD